MIIDFHTHCFPDAVVDRAMARLAPLSGASRPYTDGSGSGLVRAMDTAGVDRSVVLSIATNPRQQSAVNDFSLSLVGHPRLIPFGSVHPDAPDWAPELRRLRDGGIKGIKLHPDYQGFFVNEPRLRPLYETAAALGLITVFHAGVDIGLPDPVHCAPAALAEALPAFGGAHVVAAHFGGYLLWREVLQHLCGKELYFDTATSARKMPPPWAKEILEAHGAQRILLGSDLPWAEPSDEIFFLRQAGADDTELSKILGGNAAKLLNI
ncbi:MAG: amidohydrolase family protein [Oscillospiraceae bacterium]|jgi:predicted TIM-barrel fold metal-dependent hydrolase|nr:amidohydrolase family protein [Oscillospiraceae bacterium]